MNNAFHSPGYGDFAPPIVRHGEPRFRRFAGWKRLLTSHKAPQPKALQGLVMMPCPTRVVRNEMVSMMRFSIVALSMFGVSALAGVIAGVVVGVIG